MTNKEPCLLWESARGPAADRGFEMHGECPINNSCHGLVCVFQPPDTDVGPERSEVSKLAEQFPEWKDELFRGIRTTPMETFYQRLEKHDAIYKETRLRELRRALASASPKTELRRRLNRAGEMCGSDPLVENWPTSVYPHNDKGGPMA